MPRVQAASLLLVQFAVVSLASWTGNNLTKRVQALQCARVVHVRSTQPPCAMGPWHADDAVRCLGYRHAETADSSTTPRLVVI